MEATSTFQVRRDLMPNKAPSLIQVHTAALRNFCFHFVRRVCWSFTNDRRQPNEPRRLQISRNVVSVYNICTLDRNHGYESRTGQYIIMIIIICLALADNEIRHTLNIYFAPSSIYKKTMVQSIQDRLQ